MTVRELIRQLEKLPQNLPVYIQDHDASEHELSSCARLAQYWDRDAFEEDSILAIDREAHRLNPKECVIIRC